MKMKILILIISVVIGISSPSILIAWGMTWKWTSFAPGTADGWLGFWGGYIGALIGALLAGSIAYFISHRQINLQSEKDNQRERQFLAKQLRIQKIQEINTDLMEYIRENVNLVTTMADHIFNKIDQQEFKKINESQQDKILYLTRRLVVNEVFFEDLEREVAQLKKESIIISDKVSNWYRHLQSPPEIPLPEEYRPQVIKENLEAFTTHGGEIVKSFNRILYDEIKSLK